VRRPQALSTTITAGPAQLVLGGTGLQAVSDARLEVDLFEERGREVRVGVRLPALRFALWTSRDRLLGVLAYDQRVAFDGLVTYVPGSDPPGVTLKAGARVERAGHRSGATRVIYRDNVEVEGWVPDSALRDTGPADRRRFPLVGRRPQLMTPGTVIHDSTEWASRALATMRFSFTIDQIAALDDGWFETVYEDTEVRVHGFASKRLPPGRYASPRRSDTVLPFASTTTALAGTCLYAGTERVGYVVTDAPAIIEPSPRVGWFAVTLDTPWGPVPFDARGPTDTSLETCAPRSP